MTDYLLKNAPGKKTKVAKSTPQTKRVSKDQVKNSAGGFVYQIDEFARLQRFLVLGSEGGTYYTSEKKLTKQNAKNVLKCIKKDGLKTVAQIVEVSKSGRAPKNDPALYALALCISEGDLATKRAAAAALPEVARIGTHLYHFCAYVETMRGWGALLRWAVKNWYESKPAEKLAYDAIKYRQRDGWTHRDVLRLAHPQGDNAPIYDYITHGLPLTKTGRVKASAKTLPDMILGYEAAQKSENAKTTAALVRQYGLPREALKTEHLNDVEVWNAMLDTGMPMTAMIRNLPTMTRNGVFKSAAYKKIVLDQLQNVDALHKARIHPLNVLTAMKTYAGGHSMRQMGQNLYGAYYIPDTSKGWTPVGDIVDALDDAFYACFDNVTPSGKNHLIGVDISGSMGAIFGPSPLQCIEAAAALAMVALHAEPEVTVGVFNTQFTIRKGLSKRQRLDDAVKTIVGGWGYGTDCAKPYQWATKQDHSIEAFISITDNETWHGNQHPKQALDEYRQKSGHDAKGVVVGMTATEFSIADPNDPGMLDVVGFDSAAPSLISEFVAGSI